MFIQNYDDLDGVCQEQAEFLGHLGKAILSPHISKSQKEALIRSFRMGLMDLSQKTGRPIEVADVNGEIWINIREHRPISKEAIENFLICHPTPSPKPISYEDMMTMVELHKKYDISTAPTVNMTDRIKSQWRW